jgi:hypothetical protein
MIQIFIFARSRAISIRPRFYPTNPAIAVLSFRARERERAPCRSFVPQASIQAFKHSSIQAFKTQIPSMRIKWYMQACRKLASTHYWLRRAG